MTDLIVYLKNPEPGNVKTRLHSRYSPDEAAKLYSGFIEDTVETASAVGADRYFAAFTPHDAGAEVAALVPPDWNLIPQTGEDLGIRMRRSLNASIASGADRVVLVGSDIPSLPPGHITSAFARLDSSDVVLGPTNDGGFYLIGIKAELPEIFLEVTWSTDLVFEQTAEGIRQNGMMMSLTPPWNDIDTPEDLDAEMHAARNDDITLYHTGRIYDRISSSNP